MRFVRVCLRLPEVCVRNGRLGALRSEAGDAVERHIHVRFESGIEFFEHTRKRKQTLQKIRVIFDCFADALAYREQRRGVERIAI